MNFFSISAGAACISLAVLCGCRKTADRELVIISPHSPEIRAEFSAGFSRWYKQRTAKIVEIKWLDVGGTGEVIEYIRSRNSGKRQAGGVDVFFGGGDFPYIKLAHDSLLVAFFPPDTVLSAIPPDINGAPIRGDASLWYGTAISGFGIIYNKEICRLNGLPFPDRWEELALPRFHGWVSSGDPRYSGSIHMMYEILLQAYGWEKGWDVIMRMAANVQTFTKGAGSSAKSVSIGQAAAGLAIDFYAFIEIERYGKERLGFVLPKNQTVVSADGIAILKNAPSIDIARMFMEYVLGEGQKLWILKKGVDGGPVFNALCRFPVDRRLYALDTAAVSVSGNPYELPMALHYNAALGGRRWAMLGDMLAAYIITPHEDLKQCYAAMAAGMVPAEKMARVFRVDITEKEALALASEWGKRDFALKKIKIMNEWTSAARKRYRQRHSDF
jgi:ABC-type Fe3+ transport system substrate-binding protein